MGLDSLIVDANVLIDYAETEPQILALVTRFIGPVLIPRPLLHEVQQLSEKECRSLGLELMADLVRGRKLAPERALDVAWAIQASNPTHITPAIIERFERRLEADS